MSQVSAHQFKQVFEDLGYDLGKLGCIMLDLEPVDFEVDDSQLYYAKDKTKFWIDGKVATKTPHVTLLYGLLRSGQEMKKHVDAVLDGFNFESVTIDHVDFFNSPYEDEPYYCIVAHLLITDQLQAANEHLKFLPHINTFPGYKAHFSLAYIKKDDSYRDELIGQLNQQFAGRTVKAKELNYGGDK